MKKLIHPKYIQNFNFFNNIIHFFRFLPQKDKFIRILMNRPKIIIKHHFTHHFLLCLHAKCALEWNMLDLLDQKNSRTTSLIKYILIHCYFHFLLLSMDAHSQMENHYFYGIICCLLVNLHFVLLKKLCQIKSLKWQLHHADIGKVKWCQIHA